ncbi:MAG: hypothetical protein M1826_000557 [Phylliscum demangeonii]|nr:MAG: hypothetical protein M1826_000557 [Phylliscum demangeonii]
MANASAHVDHGCPAPHFAARAPNRRRFERFPPPVLSTAMDGMPLSASQLSAQSSSPATSLATSLSSPFVGSSSAHSMPSPESISNHASPVLMHASNAAYDPSSWPAGLGHRPAAISTRPRNRGNVAGGDAPEGLSPPPPYSPQHPTSRSAATSPAEPNASRPGTSSGPAPGAPFIAPRGYPAPRDAGPGNSPLHFPPPPAAGDRRARSSSRPRDEPSQSLFSLSALTSRVRASGHRHDAAGYQHPAVPHPQPHRATTMNSRRAASTGAIGWPNAPTAPHAIGSVFAQAGWEPGMPLPPPPPGPPPAPAPRTQSLNRPLVPRSSTLSGAGLAPESSTRPYHPIRSALSPVPPTPADWVDRSNDERAPSLKSASASGPSLIDLVESPRDPTRAEWYDDLARLPPTDDRPARPARGSIRERRIESRGARRQMSQERNASNPWADDMPQGLSSVSGVPADLVLSSAGPPLTRRRAVSRASPRTPRSLPALHAGYGSSSVAPPVRTAHSRSSTKSSAVPDPGSDSLVLTSPLWSTDGADDFSSAVASRSPSTPLPEDLLAPSDRPLPAARPLAPLRHAPHDHAAHPLPSPRRPARPGPRQEPAAEDFARAAIERHQAFAQTEAVAATDRERVQLFAAFMVRESRIRRSRYGPALDSMGSEILELTRDLFRPGLRVDEGAATAATGPLRPPLGSLNAAVRDNVPPPDSPRARPESAWWKGYMPSLSPIPSMSVTEVPDEMKSRGRPASRWWESSKAPSAHDGGGRGLERSKRESKYMGLPLREWDEAHSPTGRATAAGPPAPDYPAEKVAWHESVTPRSSDPRKLDVSRLVTLPPPYPRHYPAVHNNHPDLAALRTVVRGLGRREAVTALQQTFAARCADRQAEADATHQQRLVDVRQRVDAGRMSYAEAARATEAEARRRQQAMAADFEAFQRQVLDPSVGAIAARVAEATTALEQLQRQLAEHNPIEEGDEQPELLEKLTLMKWLFEAREQLHRELDALSAEKNARYQAVVVSAYADPDPIASANAFFARDRARLRVGCEQGAVARHEAFLDVVEDTVKKGVEIQLSTFWDLAPPLIEVLQRVQVEQGVQTDGEYEFSQQYLWEVLCHAEKSVYQFIEGQTNLLCLLHEVKSGVAKQACRLMAAERRREGGATELHQEGECATELQREEEGATELQREEEGATELQREEEGAAELHREEEERLTADLKVKVKTVENQWDESLGRVMERLKERVRLWLQEHGGWEACEDD